MTRRRSRSSAGRAAPCYYGDATNPEFLKSCGLMEAAAVIVTINESDGIDEIVGQVRALRQDMPIVSRARDAEHARHLYGIGVTDAVPETIEASLLLSEAALIGLGVPMGLVIATIHEKRDEFRHELQQAAGNTASAARPVAGTKNDAGRRDSTDQVSAPCSSPAGYRRRRPRTRPRPVPPPAGGCNRPDPAWSPAPSERP